MITKIIVMDFKSIYHVGWRTPEPIIEGLTIHRALIHTSTMIEGDDRRVKDLVDLKTSAALPVIKYGDCYKIILPLPPIPSRILLKKMGLKYITMRAVNSLLQFVKERPLYITNARIIEKEGIKQDEEKRCILVLENGQLCYTREVVHECGEKIDPPPRVIERVDLHVNRIDRATQSADVYKVSGYKPITKLGVVIQSDLELIDYATRLFSVLKELGLGGLRSRGFGKFTIETSNLCDQDLIKAEYTKGYIALLGSYEFSSKIDLTKSYINKRLLMGYAGPAQNSYILPCIDYIGSGSVVYANENLDPIKKDIKTSRTGSIIVFNPVIIGDNN